MEMRFEKRYLNLPVKKDAEKRRMRVIIDGKTVREFEIELAERDPDFWVFLDLNPFQGQQATIEVDGLPENSRAFRFICQDDTVPGFDSLYRETYRPCFHFSSRRGWNNDPNGLVYYKGEYHLYYQHNPYGRKWGNMHWGHAVSPDLVHWEELPIAIYPRQFGDWVFSGSAVVDWRNTGGFKRGDEDVIIAAYTSTGRGECIAYSNDRGRTFTDYEGNPVVKHRGRDPKVIWYEPGEHWVMAVYDEFEDKRYIAFYTSENLKEWQFQSRIKGYFECPEIFELPVDRDPENKKWVVYAADGAYAIGNFDGRRFTPESGKHPFNWGNCFYASQTYSDIPPGDGRRIQIAWGQIGHPDMPFNQMMNFPVQLTLRTTDEGLRMFAEPVPEIGLIHRLAYSWKGQTLVDDVDEVEGVWDERFHIRAQFTIGDAPFFGIVVRGVPVVYDVKAEEICCQDKRAPLKPQDGKIRLELLVDRLSIEIFGNDGRVYMPMGLVLPTDERSVAWFSREGRTHMDEFTLYRLETIWP